MQAGDVASQAITQVRTVAAYTGEPRALEQYSACLEAPLQVRVTRRVND